VRDSADSSDPAFGRVHDRPRTNSKRQRNRFDDEETFAKRDRHVKRLATAETAADATDGLAPGERWSTWDQSTPTERGPRPHPPWLVTDLAAIDTELGIVKTGKEADVFLIRRAVPVPSVPVPSAPVAGGSGGQSCLLAAKRYRDPEHRLFHRDAGYLEGRRTRDSRVSRAAANRTAFGRQAIAGMWANAEFAALCLLYEARVPVPYPVQITGTEVLLEFIGDSDGTAAPRLAETRPDDGELADLWDQLVEALVALARRGYAHGDLSPYNLLVHSGTLVMIDLPQVVDVIAHPSGRDFLERDATNVARWFAARGLQAADPEKLAGLLVEEARLALHSAASECAVLAGEFPGPQGGPAAPGRVSEDLLLHRELAVAHRAEALGAAGDGAVVGHHDHGQPLVLPELLEQGDDLVAGVLVQVAGRLVGEQHLGLLHQRAGDRRALLLTAGEL